MFKHILVPTDGSRASARAIAMAVRLAKSLGARLTVMHVIPDLPMTDYLDAVSPYPSPFSAAEVQRAAERHSKAMLAEVAEKARAQGVRCDILTHKGGSPWQAIIRQAKSKSCDAIVMASHGRRGLEAVLLGSETHKVLTHGKTPVLVCR